MTNALPFRLFLRGTPDESTTRTLMSLHDAEVRQTSLPALDEVIASGDELVLWSLARLLHKQGSWYTMGVYPIGKTEFLAAVASVIARALRDADAEGLVWTPVLDAAAGSKAWSMVVTEKWPGKERFGIPTEEERIAKLAAWVAACRDPAQLEDLLRFRAGPIRKVVAANAQALSREAMLDLAKSAELAELLRKNPATGAGIDEALVRKSFEDWKHALANRSQPGAPPYDEIGETEKSVLVSLLRKGVTLPDEIRDELFAMALNTRSFRPDPRPDLAADILLEDRNTPVEMLRQLKSNTSSRNARILLHPNCSDDLWAELIRQGYDLQLAMKERQFPTEKLDVAYAHHSTNGWAHDIIAAFFEQENIRKELVLKELAYARGAYKSRLLISLSRNPVARKWSEVRELLLRSSSAEVVTNLVADGNADDYERSMLKLLRVNREEALKILNEQGIPAGIPMPKKLAERLLTSEDREERMLGITLLSTVREKSAENEEQGRATDLQRQRAR